MDWQDKPGASAFATLIGPLQYRREGDRFLYGLRVLPTHANGNGVMHGGLMTAFLDEAIGNAVHDTDAMRHVTVQLDVRFLQPVQIGAFIACDCGIVHRAGSMSFLEAKCRVGAQIVASATAIYKAIRPRTERDAFT
jgi:acyl-coenzyme A thioesterase PaaI-like protein